MAAIGRSPGPTSTASSCSRTVDTCEQPAGATLAARATVRAKATAIARASTARTYHAAPTERSPPGSATESQGMTRLGLFDQPRELVDLGGTQPRGEQERQLESRHRQ